MPKLSNSVVILLIALGIMVQGFRPKPNPKPLKASLLGIDSITLKSMNGNNFQLKQFPNTKGFIVVFTCNHCPFAQLYSNRLNAIYQEYASQQVALIAVNSMDTLMYAEESFQLMQAKAKQDKFLFPYLQDADQRFGKAFNAEHTPQVFVLWKDSSAYNIRYQGSIDDNGQDSAQVNNHYLETAVDALLKNEVVKVPFTESFGCRIFYRKP